MSGHGGITIAMLPDGVTYYHLMNNEDFNSYNAVHGRNKLSPMYLAGTIYPLGIWL